MIYILFWKDLSVRFDLNIPVTDGSTNLDGSVPVTHGPLTDD